MDKRHYGIFDLMKDIQQIIIHVLQNDVSEEEMAFFSEWFHSSSENKDLFFHLKVSNKSCMCQIKYLSLRC